MRTVKEYAEMFWNMGNIMSNTEIHRQNLEAVISRAMRAAVKDNMTTHSTLSRIDIVDPIGGWPEDKITTVELKDVGLKHNFVIPPPNCKAKEVPALGQYKLCGLHRSQYDDRLWIYSIAGGNTKYLPGNTKVVIIEDGSVLTQEEK